MPDSTHKTTPDASVHRALREALDSFTGMTEGGSQGPIHRYRACVTPAEYENWQAAAAGLTAWAPPPPGDTREQLPDDVLALIRPYLPAYESTACTTRRALDAAITDHPFHASTLAPWRDRMAARCRHNQKFTGQLCDHGNGQKHVVDHDGNEPTHLRWGLNDVMWGDDDTITVMLSGPQGEPYWLELNPERAAALREDLAGPENQDDFTDHLKLGRKQLLEAMSAVSEDRACCGWASDWARTLHAEGGIWENLGRAVGWPTGNYDQWVWVSWDEAATLYAREA